MTKTREGAAKRLKDILAEATETDDSVCYVTSDDVDVFKTAIEALEQEPCEDCISRENAIKQCGFGMTSLLIANSLRRLPPVTPHQKMGRWILTDVEGNRVWHCDCSECKKDPQDYIGGSENWWLIKNKLPKYCPNCGVKIQEVGKT